MASAIVLPALDNPDIVSYSSACSSKLLAMALSLKKRVCQFCLTPCRSQAGHRSCLAFYNRLVSLMLVYIQNEHHHTVRLTPIFIIEYLRLNYSLDPSSLDSILLYLQELFDAFWHDFEEFFKSFFRHQHQQASSSIMRCILLIQHCGGGFFKISYEVLSCNIMFCENKILEQTNVLFCQKFITFFPKSL